MLYQLGRLCLFTEKYHEAINYFDKAIPCLKVMENPTKKARTLNDLAIAYYKLNKLDGALEILKTALVICKNSEDRYIEALIQKNLEIISTDFEVDKLSH